MGYRLAIDAINIKKGGGVTHLVNLINHFKPDSSKIDSIVIWADKHILALLPDADWLIKCHFQAFESNNMIRTFWSKLFLKKQVKLHACDLLFTPAGSCHVNYKPVVTMSRNMLPIEREAYTRYGLSLKRLRLFVLRRHFLKSYQRCTGVIFLASYAYEYMTKRLGLKLNNHQIIPHGITESFTRQPLKKVIKHDDVIKIVYVSTIDFYKHQDVVVEAMLKLIEKGYRVEMSFVGRGYGPAIKVLKEQISKCGHAESIKYVGPVPFAELPELYHEADLFLYASSCENLPNILLEAMSASCRIVCSDRGPMPEVLKDGGVYFNPEEPSSIVSAIELVLQDQEVTFQRQNLAYQLSQDYSWKKCSEDTFTYLFDIIRKSKNDPQT